MIKKHKELYKKDSNQNTRVWWMESEDNKFRTHSGVYGGEIVVSEWTVCESKNIGKKNQTTAEEQCLLEVAANYKKKLAQGNYKETLDENSLNQDNYIKPMLAKEYGEDYEYVEGSTVFSQPKLDGCFSCETLIETEDGPIPIGKIVENRMKVKVWSYNLNDNIQEKKEILAFMSFEEPAEWVEIEFEDGTKLKTTTNHQLWSVSRNDWIEANNLGFEEECCGYNLTKRSPLIKSITPINSQKRYNIEVKDNNNYYANGILVHNCRCIATSKGLFSRQGKPIISAPHVLEELKSIFDKQPDLILDGELYSDRLSDNFNEIISLARKSKPEPEDLLKSKDYLQYWIYDLISDKPYEKRHEELKSLVTESSVIKLVETTKVSSKEELDKCYARYMEQGYEGQMIRISNKGYENKRTKQLIKRKEFKEEEFKLIDIVEGDGNRSGMAGNVLVETVTGKQFGAGIQGDREFFRELLKNKSDYIDTLVSIKYQNLTPDGIPRFPVAVKFWKTKTREL